MTTGHTTLPPVFVWPASEKWVLPFFVVERCKKKNMKYMNIRNSNFSFCKVLLERSHSDLFTHCLWVLSYKGGRAE